MPMLQAFGGADALKGDTDYIKDMMAKNGGRLTPELMDRMEAEMRRKGLSPAMAAMAQASAAAVAKKVIVISSSPCNFTAVQLVSGKGVSVLSDTWSWVICGVNQRDWSSSHRSFLS